MGGQELQAEHICRRARPCSKKHPPMMTTSADLSLRFDPAYEKIATFPPEPAAVRRRVRPRPGSTHRDMGRRARHLGQVPLKS